MGPAAPEDAVREDQRRILRRIAAGEVDNLGDTSTLADPQVVDELVRPAETSSAWQQNRGKTKASVAGEAVVSALRGHSGIQL
jgi:hypothetical protein